MPTIDINAAILDVLRRHTPLSRKDIYDNLPPGTYTKGWTLKECLDNISQRLIGLNKKGHVERAGHDDNNIILWTVPRAAMEPVAAMERSAIEEQPTVAAMERSAIEENPEENPEEQTTEPGADQPAENPLDALDTAFAVIRACVVDALAMPAAPTVPDKHDTLEALRTCAHILEPLDPRRAGHITALLDVVDQLEEAAP